MEDTLEKIRSRLEAYKILKKNSSVAEPVLDSSQWNHFNKRMKPLDFSELQKLRAKFKVKLDDGEDTTTELQ